MRKLFIIFFGLIIMFSFTVNLQAGRMVGSNGNWPGVAPPHSNSHGKSLDDWIYAYMRWWEGGGDPSERMRNVVFLPIFPGPEFDVEVKVGTTLVLPVATFLGFPEDDPLPDELFGVPENIFGRVYLNGKLLVELNEDYYVGPTSLVPPAVIVFSPEDIYEIAFYQSLACLILPLPPGEHELVVNSYFDVEDDPFENTWHIKVVPGKLKK